ncbi:unnamed protein product, partial [Hapterophycus canaliculatus]
LSVPVAGPTVCRGRTIFCLRGGMVPCRTHRVAVGEVLVPTVRVSGLLERGCLPRSTSEFAHSMMPFTKRGMTGHYNHDCCWQYSRCVLDGFAHRDVFVCDGFRHDIEQNKTRSFSKYCVFYIQYNCGKLHKPLPCS